MIGLVSVACEGPAWLPGLFEAAYGFPDSVVRKTVHVKREWESS